MIFLRRYPRSLVWMASCTIGLSWLLEVMRNG